MDDTSCSLGMLVPTLSQAVILFLFRILLATSIFWLLTTDLISASNRIHTCILQLMFLVYFTVAVIFNRQHQMYSCQCGRRYKHKKSVYQHQRYECGKEPTFRCSFCPYKAKRKCNLNAHAAKSHGEQLFNITWKITIYT